MSNNINDQIKPATAAVSLRNCAMIAVLHVCRFSNLRNSKDLATELETNHGTKERKAFNVKKYLIDDDTPTYTAIKKAESAARTAFNKQTLPWEVSGARILAAEAYMDFLQTMKGHRFAYQNAVDAFVAEWPHLVARAQIQLNGQFRASDYPADISTEFGFELSFTPLSDAADFRVDLPQEEITRIQREIEQRQGKLVEEARAELFDRLLEPIRNMAFQLDKKDARIYESLVDNVQAVAKLAKQYNFDKNPKLDELCGRIKTDLAVSTHRLRDSQSLRRQTATRARSIAADLAAFMQGGE